MNKILTLLSTLCTCLAALLRRKRKARRAAITDAVHTGDTETVTDIHHTLIKN